MKAAVLLFLWSCVSGAATVDVQAFEVDPSPLKALVFLSDDCPCSRSHVEHLNRLSTQGLKIYGVISEPIHEGMKASRRKQLESYYAGAGFQFPLISDPQQILVKTYGALKTPHATLFRKIESGHEVVYQGGVTNQKDFEKSNIRYLEENVKELLAGRPVKYKKGHSLGCYIRRI